MVICEDVLINLEVVDQFNWCFFGFELILVEFGGDNLLVIFSFELFDLIFYVIDVFVGDKILCKGGFGICKLDLLVINKIDLVLLVGVFFDVMDWDVWCMCGDKLFVFSNQKIGQGLDEIIVFIECQGLLIVV